MTTAEFREKYRIEQVGPRYSGPLHLAFTSTLSLAVIALALSLVRAPGWALLTVPATFLYANLIEYLGHKGPMHHPSRLLRLVHRRHTLEHHAFFTRAEMQVDSPRDFKMVLFPPLLIAFFFGVFALPAGLLLRALAGPNVALLFVATAMAYFLCYEWLHLAYHLGHGGPLRRHHAAHHDPALMARRNFNITFPVCDLLFGTAQR
jgi:hypothetical protein